MLGPIERKLFLGFFAAAILTAVLGYGSYREVRGFLDSDRLVDHTRDVLAQIKAVGTAVTQGERAQRGHRRRLFSGTFPGGFQGLGHPTRTPRRACCRQRPTGRARPRSRYRSRGQSGGDG